MKRIVVLNPKGGSGKTTIATSLASYYAAQGLNPVLMDYDPQGSSMRWLKKRPREFAPIHGIAAYERNPRVTRTFQLRIPHGTQRVVVDTPAAIDAQKMPDLTGRADAILVPVLPSEIDIHACSRCIANLLLVAKVSRQEQRIGVIANRVKKNTLAYQSLMRFLESLRIPVVATLRDSQAYLRAVETGVGVHDNRQQASQEDIEQWEPLVKWLESRRAQDGATVPGEVMEEPASPPAAQLNEAVFSQAS